MNFTKGQVTSKREELSGSTIAPTPPPPKRRQVMTVADPPCPVALTPKSTVSRLFSMFPWQSLPPHPPPPLIPPVRGVLLAVRQGIGTRLGGVAVGPMAGRPHAAGGSLRGMRRRPGPSDHPAPVPPPPLSLDPPTVPRVQVGSLVATWLRTGQDAEKVAQCLVKFAINEPQQQDNVTAAVVCFREVSCPRPPPPPLSPSQPSPPPPFPILSPSQQSPPPLTFTGLAPTSSGANHQPPTANRQPLPTATNHQSPTTNRRQPPPIANRQPPTANRQPIASNRQPPIAISVGEGVFFLGDSSLSSSTAPKRPPVFGRPGLGLHAVQLHPKCVGA